MNGGNLTYILAKNLFRTAKSHGDVEDVKADLERFISIIKEDERVLQVLNHPSIPLKNRKDLVRQIMSADLAQRALFVLVSVREADLVEEVYRHYVRFFDEDLQIVTVEIRTAGKLGFEIEQELIEALHKTIKKTIVIQTAIAPELIGGVQVKIGNKVLDYSVAASLKELRERMLAL